MQDLSSTMFYKAKFTVTANEPTADLLWTLIMEIRGWLLSKWNIGGHTIIDSKMKAWTRFKNGGKIFDEEKTNHVYAESVFHISEDSAVKSWACKIVEKKDPVEGYAQREWTTEIGYQSKTDMSAEISYVVTYNDMPGFIGFCEDNPVITVPRVIRKLLDHDKIKCSIGPDTLTNDPIWLNPGDYPSFEKVLFNPEREVPVIYISPCRSDEDADDTDLLMLVNPIKLAKSVAANALVYCSNNIDFASEMRWYIDERYGCAGGAIRLYRPKININDHNDRFKHRFIPAAFIRENGEECVFDIFRRALAQDVHFYETMFRLDSCKALVDEDERHKKIKAIRAKSETEIDEAMREYLDESDKREAAEQRAREYKEELDRLKSDNFNLELQVDALRETASQAKMIEAASQSVRTISDYPNTPQAIAKYFETVYPDRVVFTERAYRSMNECQTRSDFLWEVFYHVANDLYDLLHENPAQAYKEFTQRTGWDCSRGVGSMTHVDRSLMKQYFDVYNGQEINIEAHIKNGTKDNDPKSIRLYFAYEPQLVDKIIIGHCGKHLDNYSTKKIR